MARAFASLMVMRWFILVVLLPVAASAAVLKFSSGETRTHLLELFSSEGCSSCPPAEAWLGGLRTSPSLWRDFVPVAFHVGYWDRLGWRDRFARKEYTERQYAHAHAWGTGNVYTPAFVLDGAEWRNSAAPGPLEEKAGRLSVEYAAGACRIDFAPPGDFEVHVALLGGGISSRVQSGENRGRTLRHDFVVLNLQTSRLAAGAAELTVPAAGDPAVTRQALAIWITRRGQLVPVQATGGWID
jgi:hypothetical protein